MSELNRDLIVETPVSTTLEEVDYLRIREMDLEEVQELIKEFEYLNEKLSEELPLVLDSYAEVSSDKQGKNESVQKLIRATFSDHCKAINDSGAFSMVKSLIKCSLKKQAWITRYSSSKVAELIDLKEFSFLDLDNSLLRRLGPAFTLPWQEAFQVESQWRKLAISRVDENERDKSGRRSIKNSIGNYSSLRASSHLDIDKFFLSPVRLNPEDLERSLERNEEGIVMDFLSDKTIQSVFLEMLADNDSKNMLRLFLARALSEKLKEFIPTKRRRLSPLIPNINLLSEDDINACQDDESKLVELLYENDIFLSMVGIDAYQEDEGKLVNEGMGYHSKKAFDRIQATYPAVDFPEWAELRDAAEEFIFNIFWLKTFKSEELSLLSGDDIDILMSKIYSFLEENEVNPLSIPTIKELGGMEGGYALVKSISLEGGGLKNIRKKYIPWATKKLQGNDPAPLVTDTDDIPF